MIWVDRIAKKIKERNLPLEWVDDMKTPSGRAHAGSLRTMVIHDIVYKALLDLGVNTKFTYFFDDHDPMDGMPVYLEKSKWEKYMGMQLYKIPSPEPGYKSFAEYFAKDFQNAFEKINCHPEIIWSSEVYNSGRMNGVIKEILDHAEVIRSIYKTVTKKEPQKDWIPFNPVCQNCQKVGTTKAYKWDGEFVYYRCVPDQVKWAKGCGHDGKVSPYDGNGKLPWKIEWAAKWKVIGITVEGAGKDHMTKGGSHDIASEICKKVLNYPVPHAFSYEFFTIGGGKKMSSSKGAGISAKLLSEILPPEILRFLIIRTPIESHLDFDPYGDTILNLFDDYDRCMNAYFLKMEGNVPKDKAGDVVFNFARIMELSQVRMLPDKRVYLPRFRTIVNLLHSRTDLLAFFEKQKKSPLTPEEKEILEEREIYAQIYLKSYASKNEQNYTTIKPPKKTDLTDVQRTFLTQIVNGLENVKPDRDELQELVFSTIKKTGVKPREVFKAFYTILIGKEFGPKVGDVILDIGVEATKKRITEALGMVG